MIYYESECMSHMTNNFYNAISGTWLLTFARCSIVSPHLKKRLEFQHVIFFLLDTSLYYLSEVNSNLHYDMCLDPADF